ncbi:ABC transporter ATP-binding protein [Bacillus safensis]|uniref:ABC transporter ATP-binding protein n=1 Tax=Bacillus safensis TaxID=561879 RepID=UPI000F04FE13|nr:ABC transporter transmembrane domain-containing protein [Bacillus safensis]MED4592516.1 ABC transporter transmembrane domain-containing protein [Bacillus safensis]MED4638669.1 ABC transporter transmembrane domain-containing protein [Bacillus safensis]VCT96036.1 putative multidrug resistance ABC transporter ATP-binding/permease protein YheI [Bacillus safensis]
MFSVFAKLGWFFKQEWRRYTIAITLLLIVNVLEMLPPRYLGQAVDDIRSGQFTTFSIVFYVTIFCLLGVVVYTLTYFWMYQLFGGANVMERVMRGKLMRHLLKMTPTFYEKKKTGNLMALGTNDLNAVALTTGFGVLTLVDSTAYMLMIFFTMGLTISWKLTLMAIIPMPLMALLIAFYGSKIHERFTVAQDAFGDMNDRVLESVAGVRVIRSFVQEKQDVERFREMTDDVFQKNMRVAIIDSLFEPTVKLLVGISYLIGIGYGAYLVFQSDLTIGELVAFNVYLGMMIWPMFAIGELINIMQRGNASLDRLNHTLSYKPDVTDAAQPKTLQEPGDIEFDHVTFRYPTSSKDNLIDVSFTVRKGQTIGITGKTGSGKTTIVKQLLRQYPAGDGQILLSGVPIQDIELDQLFQWIGYVPQDHILFSKSVEQNMRFGHRDAKQDELAQAIKDAYFEKDLRLLPEGLETMVGEKGVALSGGQKQRISIARALLIDPDILILDDSLSAVDAKTETAILENLRQNRHGKTTFITTHRLSAVEHADLILVMEEGRIVQKGTHNELIQQDGWYKEQFLRQQLTNQLEGGDEA